MPTLSPRKLLFAATLATTASGSALASPAATPLTTASGRPACGNVNSKRQCSERRSEPATLSADAAAPLRTPADRLATGNVGQRGQTDAAVPAVPAVAAVATGPAGPATLTASPAVAAAAAAPAGPAALALPDAPAAGGRGSFFAGLRGLLRASISPAVALTPLLTADNRPACSNLVGKGEMTSSESTVLLCRQGAP